MAAPSDPLDTAALRKARGAFFTPEPLARHVTEWAIRSTADKILEPSCGEAAFLMAAVDRLTSLAGGTTGSATACLDGVDIHEASAREARRLVSQAGVAARVTVGDFFALEPTGSYDVVIGNPPYVRYQDFTGESRVHARVAALRAGVPLSRLASSWAAFTVHAALFLKKGGRLGLVLPAELLTVNYAAEVRRFLMRNFARIDLVLFEERVFPDVLQEVVLLLAEGYEENATDRCRVYHARDAYSLARLTDPRIWRPESSDAKWTGSLLSADELTAYSSLLSRDGFASLEEWGDTTLGMVTGNNRYFSLSPARAREFRLRYTDIIRLSPPGSRHLRNLAFTEPEWTELGAAGAPTYLFRPAGKPSTAAEAYLAMGQAQGVERAYKCRVREPWWRVPLVQPADLFLTYMNADTPRLCANRAKAHHLNSVHGVYLKPDFRALGMDLLPPASLNSMTLLGAETVGRAYGGGMLKIEPREADRLPVPSPELLAAAREDLVALCPRVERHLRSGLLLEAVKLVDELILVGHLGVSPADVRALSVGHANLAMRRAARGRRRVSR